MPEERTGLKILLTVVVLVFLIGLIIVLFTIFGSELQNATEQTIESDVVNETVFFVNGTGTATSVDGLENVALTNVVVEGCI